MCTNNRGAVRIGTSKEREREREREKREGEVRWKRGGEGE